MTVERPRVKTFIIAAVVILLCLVAISGATYALFSDQNDGKIGVNVTSGNLEVDIIDATENPNSLVGEVLDFKVEKVGEDAVLFEPGALYYTEGFRIANTGDMPIKYLLFISKDDTLGTEFYDAFDVWITTEEPKDRVIPANLNELYEFEGELEREHVSDVYFLVFRMKETAGNEYQGQEYSGVGITVIAVQGNGSLPPENN